MKKYWRYFSYLFRHKWYVFLACWKYGIALQGIVHDWSKFLPDEAGPYAKFFYDKDRRKDAFYTPKQGNEEFNMAWLKHQHRNPHHWQYYVLQEDDGPTFPLKIPNRYLKEMLCDWIGAGRAGGNPDTRAWYATNRNKMVLHVDSRSWIERELGYDHATSSSES
jgi:hypothetical protein